LPDWVAFPALFGVGLVAGALNVVAGGGSFLTLPVLIFFGLPATVANATNRVGILTQNVAAVWGFHRYRVLAWRWAFAAAGPALVGAALGTWAALEVSDEAFRKILALLMVAITLWSLLDRSGRRVREGELPARPTRGRLAILAAGFFAVGIYGGFVQAGVGFLILAVTTFAGLDLVRGNAIKVTTALLFTALSLAIFVWQDMVEWLPGLALGAGNAVGAVAGVRLTVLKGHRWLKAVVTVTVIVFAVLLWVR
jgi:hypothetical protein